MDMDILLSQVYVVYLCGCIIYNLVADRKHAKEEAHYAFNSGYKFRWYLSVIVGVMFNIGSVVCLAGIIVVGKIMLHVIATAFYLN